MRKQCQMCKKTKDESEFHKSKTTKSGLSTYCANCKVEANKRSNNKRLSENRKKFLDQRKNWNLKQTFGISLDQYNDILNQQNGVCAICGKTDSVMLCVDHNHDTGKVRGLLCNQCNRGLGMFYDNPASLIRASEYIVNWY